MNSFRSVKFRLTIWYAFVLTVLLSLFTFLMHAEFARALYLDADRNLLREARFLKESLSGYIEKELPTSDLLKLGKVDSLTDLQKTDLKLKLYDLIRQWEREWRYLSRQLLMVRVAGWDRTLVLSNLRGWETEIIFPDFERDSIFMEKGSSFQTVHFRKKPIRLHYQSVAYGKNILLIIQCGKSLHEVEGALARLVFIIWMWIPVAVFGACIAGWFLAKRSFRPLDFMIREARQITAAYMNGRLPRTQTGDELDRLAATLNEMIDRIEASTRAVQEFSIDVSHELKTPLAIIRGEIELALRRKRSPDELTRTLRVIEEEVNGLIRLVDDLMLLVRSDSKQLHFEKKMILLPALLQYVAQIFQDKAHKKQIRLSFEPGSRPVFVLGDDVYLKRLFSNLVDNAIKFTPSGGWVRILLKPTISCIEVDVLDNGMGIESGTQEKVFLRFYRADSARSYEGSGLGLNIAKAICEAHQGQMIINSQPNVGTTVTVRLPLP